MRTRILRLNTISIAILALCLAVPACGGWEEGIDEEGGPSETGQDSQALLFQRPSAPGELGVAEPDLVGEILSCGYDTFEVAIRNEGSASTHAESCAVIGTAVVCFDTFAVDACAGSWCHRLHLYDLAPGEEEIQVLSKPAGWEGLVWIDVDTYGSGDHSVHESNEDNNYSEAFCVM